MSDSIKLEDNWLYKTAVKIGEYADNLVAELPDEERWRLASKLSTRSLDVTSDIAEAFGSIDPRDKKWSFGMARRDLFGLKNSFKICHSRKYVDIDPEIMIAIDNAIKEIDRAIKQAEKNIPNWFNEMNPPVKKGRA